MSCRSAGDNSLLKRRRTLSSQRVNVSRPMSLAREKAHPDVFNIMLQLLDDGRVTDSKGNVVNFCNCIIIFTSNVGSQTILDVSSAEGEGVREVCMHLCGNSPATFAFICGNHTECMDWSRFCSLGNTVSRGLLIVVSAELHVLIILSRSLGWLTSSACCQGEVSLLLNEPAPLQRSTRFQASRIDRWPEEGLEKLIGGCHVIVWAQEMRSRVMTAMREGFRPEFLNRIDEFVIFDRLSVKDMRQISSLELKKVTLRLADRDITLEATDAALDFLSSVG